ncbi:regulatory protein GemA [Pectobacterium aroidearum]|nr:regulatory protein GemA [Pectobacterium aroidearum]MBA5235265.1 regulatory protein GemA [Pectobacterium aroidearum]
MDKQQLTRLIHVAKGKLKIDDDTYRALLANVANGKTSCSEMNHKELESVYSAMREKGFKRSFKKHLPRVKPDSKGRTRTDEIPKIRAIWITMHKHGFINSSDEVSLNAYVKRMTVKLNNGQGVDELGWLNAGLAYRVLESIKQWHIRLMLKSMTARRKPHPINPRTGNPARDYDVIADAYEDSL